MTDEERGFAGLTRWGHRALGGTFLVLAAPGLMLGTVLLGWTGLRALGTRPAAGTVVALESDDHADGSGYRPVVEYSVGAEKHRVTGLVAWNPPMFRVGDSVRVLYKVDRPGVAIIDAFFDRWFLPGLFILTSSVFMAIGWAVFRGDRFVTEGEASARALRERR